MYIYKISRLKLTRTRRDGALFRTACQRSANQITRLNNKEIQNKNKRSQWLVDEGGPLKLYFGNPTDSLESQSIEVLYKNSVFKSWWVDRGRIKPSHLLFCKSVIMNCKMVTKVLLTLLQARPLIWKQYVNMGRFSAKLPILIAEVLFIIYLFIYFFFVISAVQDLALILLSVVSEPFHASCQQRIFPFLQYCLIPLLNPEKHSQSLISFMVWCKILSIQWYS